MSNLNVIEYEGVLVVDSRLIAQELRLETVKQEALRKLWVQGGH